MSGPDAPALEWLAYARADLDTARLVVESGGVPGGPAAYLCQQAAEKLLKAVLVHHGTRPERTHDLGRLARAVLAREPGLRASAEPVIPLTSWAVETRYPDVERHLPIELEEVAAVLPQLDVLLAAVRAILSVGDESA